MSTLGDIEYYRGDSYPFTLTISDSVSHLPIDITGYTFTLTVDPESDPVDNTNNIFSLTGVVAPDQVLNKGKVDFSPSSENNSQVGVYYYDIQMSNALSGFKRTIKKGYNYTILQDITKI